MEKTHFHAGIRMMVSIVAKRYAKCASYDEAMKKLTELNELFDRMDQELMAENDSNDVYRNNFN